MADIATCIAAGVWTCAKGLSTADAAGWAQAVGTVLAIGVSAWISLILSNRARQQTIEDIRDAGRRKQFDYAAALTTLAENALTLQKSIAGKLVNREAVFKASEDRLPFDMSMLRGLESSLFAVPLHEIPADLLTLALILRETVAQFRMKVEMAFQFHSAMDAAKYEDFFATLASMNKSLGDTVRDFQAKRAALDKH